MECLQKARGMEKQGGEREREKRLAVQGDTALLCSPGRCAPAPLGQTSPIFPHRQELLFWPTYHTNLNLS